MRLIDADAIVTVQIFDVEHEEYKTTKMTAGEYLDIFTDEGYPPTVEPKRGRWERHFSRPNVYADLYWWCTCCGRPTGYVSAFLYDYCPNCGAAMTEGGESDETTRQETGDYAPSIRDCNGNVRELPTFRAAPI